MTLTRSPLHACHVSLGAKMVEFGGWDMPLSYAAGTISEHLACRNDAVMFDVSHLGTVRLEGPNVFDRLQRTLTNDLTRISPGRAQYTHLLDEHGSVVDDIIVWWLAEEAFDIMPNAANTAPVTEAVGGFDVTRERAIVAVQGPQARRKLEAILPDAASTPHFAVRSFIYKGADCVSAGTGYTGEDGVELRVPAQLAAALWEDLLSCGITPAGLGARDTLRLEAALPLHGHDIGPGITPLQAGLGWVVAWDKGEFRGRDALAKEREQGVSRRLRGFVTEGRQPPRADSVIKRGEEEVGFVTSGNYSPVVGKGIALGLVSPDIPFDATVGIEVRGRSLPARLTRLPFVRTKGK